MRQIYHMFAIALLVLFVVMTSAQQQARAAEPVMLTEH